MKEIEKIIGKDFNGVISISKDGQSVFKKAYGYADLPNKRPNQTDTRFATASAGKAFVAAAIMRLIEDDKLSLDSCIGDILDFDLKEISQKITVKQLLNHTSGIPDYFDESVMEEYAELWINFPNYRVRASTDLLPLFIDKPMMYNPGEKFQYNNTGYVVLGLVVEQVTGVPFDEFLSKAIFEPCGMSGTGYYELDRLPACCANAYIHDEARDEYYTNIYSVDAKGTGAGGAFTTADDVECFWTHLLKGEIVSKETAAQMLAPQVESKEYGFGFWLDGKLPYFQGSDPGVSFMSSHDGNGLFVCVISNLGDDVWEIHEEICEVFANMQRTTCGCSYQTTL
ncbi:MAG: beta-lactamase family protein [Oscillospiraceae bacterium]|nr:beta-lactamase family protein [Oscillospiraceae bacterium]